MADPKIKKRQNRMIESAIRYLSSPPLDFNAGPFGGPDFHVIAYNEREFKLIRLVLDEITDHDKKIVSSCRAPRNCSVEIWCKKHKKRGFITLPKNRVNG